MEKVHERVYVSDGDDCKNGNKNWAIIHACKSPCHQKAVGYKGNLNNDHKNYLVLERKYNLYLNIIDPPFPLFRPILFSSFLSFAIKNWKEERKILIHCNQGESRAPSLALLFLAKGLAVIDNSSYESAYLEFEELYPMYDPGEGIQIYFEENWDVLGTDF